jgi:hypothetical protein
MQVVMRILLWFSIKSWCRKPAFITISVLYPFDIKHRHGMNITQQSIRIGLLDSGVGSDPQLKRHIVGSCGFVLNDDGDVTEQPAVADPIDHGSAIARILISAAPAAALVNAQVFTQSNATAPASIAAGLNWLVAQRVAIVNMSFGVRQNRTVLKEACTGALAAGVILVASAPARGPAVFPAAYPGVLRITGDARCALQEFSHLASRQADFGACPRSDQQPAAGTPSGGASFAAAHVSAKLAGFLAEGGDPARAAAYLEKIAHYHGPERRSTVPGR